MGEFLKKLNNLIFRRQTGRSSERILIIRDGALGDVLMSTPLVRILKESFFNTKISYLVGEWSKNALLNNPNVDEIITFSDEIVFKKKLFKILKLIRLIRSRKFDMCFILNKSWHWGVFAFLAGIPCRIGFDRKGEGFANSMSVPFDGSRHEIDYYLELAQQLEIPVQYTDIEFYPAKKDREFADEFFRKYKLKTKRVVVLFPGGAHNPGHQMHVKRWPYKNFSRLAKKLEKNSNLRVIWLGNPKDVPVIEKAMKGLSKTVNAAEKNLALGQSIALMEKSHCVVTPDSGPMHMAAAAKTPVVALFGPTPPHRFAPKNAVIFYKTKGCHGCYSIFTYGTLKPCKTHECMKNIKVSEVYKAVIEILKAKKPVSKAGALNHV